MKKNSILKTLMLGIAFVSASLFSQNTVTIDFENPTSPNFEFTNKKTSNNYHRKFPSRVFDIGKFKTGDNPTSNNGNFLVIENPGSDFFEGKFTVKNIDISNTKSISLSLDMLSKAKNFDYNDKVTVSYAIDNSSNFRNWFAIRNIGAYGYNRDLCLDLNLDGDTNDPGEGASSRIPKLISGSTVNFKTFNVGTKPLPTCASRLSLRFTFSGLGGGNEGLAIDNLVITKNSPVTFTGAGGNKLYTNASNWSSNTVPTSSDDVLIPSGFAVDASTARPTFKSLTIKGTGSLHLASGATVNATYCKPITNTNWYLLSSPVNREYFSDIIDNTAFAKKTGSQKIGLGTYRITTSTSSTNRIGEWKYLENTAGGRLLNGQGFAVKLDGTVPRVKIDGSLITTNVQTDVKKVVGGVSIKNGYNLIGNPFPQQINVHAFLQNNQSFLEGGVLQYWVWDSNRKQYISKPSQTPQNKNISTGEGFFIEVRRNGRVRFDTSIQNSTTSGSPRSEVIPEVQLSLKEGTKSSRATVYFIEGTTNGFDNGYEGKVFGGFGGTKFGVYTQLVADNKGVNYEVQSLPTTAIGTTKIPLSITAKAGKKLVFSAKGINLPTGVEVYLEDKLNNRTTNLSKTDYKVNLRNDANGIGQFFLYAGSSSSLSTEQFISDNISIYASNKSELVIAGLQASKAKVTIFSMLGKEVLATEVTSNGVSKINLPILATGVYIVKVSSELGEFSKKVIIE